MENLKTVVFRLNNQLCGAFTSEVNVIIRLQEIFKVPRQPKFVEGVINLRGKVIPVVDLNKRFELGETEITKKTRMIISDSGDTSIGFLVNDVTEIINFTKEDTEPAPAILQGDVTAYLKCVGKKDDKLISILDLKKILNDKELKKVEKLGHDDQ